MASFNLGPHPRMMEVLEKYNIKDKVSLPEFIEALKYEERGYRWNDLRTDSVPPEAWVLLHVAYEDDEEEINGWKAAQDNGRDDYHRGGEISRDTRDRIADALGGEFGS